MTKKHAQTDRSVLTDFPKIHHFPNITLSAGPSSTYKSVYLNGHIDWI